MWISFSEKIPTFCVCIWINNNFISVISNIINFFYGATHDIYIWISLKKSNLFFQSIWHTNVICIHTCYILESFIKRIFEQIVQNYRKPTVFFIPMDFNSTYFLEISQNLCKILTYWTIYTNIHLNIRVGLFNHTIYR